MQVYLASFFQYLFTLEFTVKDLDALWAQFPIIQKSGWIVNGRQSEDVPVGCQLSKKCGR